MPCSCGVSATSHLKVVWDGHFKQKCYTLSSQLRTHTHTHRYTNICTWRNALCHVPQSKWGGICVYLCLCLLCYLFCFSSSVPGRSCPRRSPDHSYYLIGFLLFLYLLLIVFSAQCSVYLRTVFVTVLCQFVLFAVSSLSSLQNLSQSLCLLVFLFLFMFVL